MPSIFFEPALRHHKSSLQVRQQYIEYFLVFNFLIPRDTPTNVMLLVPITCIDLPMHLFNDYAAVVNS